MPLEIAVLMGGVVVVAIVLMVVVDKLRGGINCGRCGQPIQGTYAVRRVNGKRQKVCARCDRA